MVRSKPLIFPGYDGPLGCQGQGDDCFVAQDSAYRVP